MAKSTVSSYRGLPRRQYRWFIDGEHQDVKYEHIMRVAVVPASFLCLRYDLSTFAMTQHCFCRNMRALALY